jgi:hypothetical protein
MPRSPTRHRGGGVPRDGAAAKGTAASPTSRDPAQGRDGEIPAVVNDRPFDKADSRGASEWRSTTFTSIPYEPPSCGPLARARWRAITAGRGAMTHRDVHPATATRHARLPSWRGRVPSSATGMESDMRLMIESLDFVLKDGETETGRRRRCLSCGVPVACVRRGRINQDGTAHGRTCSHLFTARRGSLRRGGR